MTENSNKALHDEMEKTLVGYLEKERCLNVRELIDIYARSHDNVSLDSIGGQIDSVLNRLEKRGRVEALFPRGVDSKKFVPMEKRYYVLTEPMPVERVTGC